MSFFTRLRITDLARLSVAAVCDVPRHGEAIRSSLEVADGQMLAARGGDVDGLVRRLRASALIFESRDRVDEAAAPGHERDLSVLRVAMQKRGLGLYCGGAWHRIGDGDGLTPASIRNVVAGAVGARAGAKI